MTRLVLEKPDKTTALLTMEQLVSRSKRKIIELAYLSDLTETTLRNYIKGRNVPEIPLPKLAKLIELLDCTFDEFVRASDQAVAEHKAKQAAKA